MDINTRREFLKFLGYGTVTLSTINLLSSCTSTNHLSPLLPSSKDDLLLMKGLNYYPVISWNDPINKNEVFGFNNDYINIEYLNETELIMWVNHEYVHPLFVSSMERTKKNIDIEKSLVGGSLIHLKLQNNKWSLETNSPYNRGVRGNTKIPFANDVSIKGSKIVEGTLANCAGGKTPWNTFLTCEENYDGFYGERKANKEKIKYKKSRVHWYKSYPKNVPEHYGWVVEIEPKTGMAQKHTNLGRFAHESATCVQSKSGNTVVYSGDDKANQFLYKFISTTNKDLKNGTLYVANVKEGIWLPLDINKSPILKTKFKNQLDVVTYAREAAELLGATPLNRPEDIEINPITGDVFVALTNNKKAGDFHGSILKISEDKNDYSSLKFKSETFLFGGEATGFSCPDNMAFDQKGNLWITTDISGSAMGKSPYKSFGNNGLFMIPANGKEAGKPLQIASAPNDAEFTGICFTKDFKTLFLSVQHPGELTKDLSNPTSKWPTGSMPKPTVVAIHGDTLSKLINQN